MTSNNFLADVLDRFQSSADWLEIVWLRIPPGFVLGPVAIVLRYRIERQRVTGRDRGARVDLETPLAVEAELLRDPQPAPRA